MTHWLERTVDMSDLPVSAPPQTLADFLLARIAEDEANCGGEGPDYSCDAAFQGDHYTRARILAECEAKRQIVEDYRLAHEAHREIGLTEWPAGMEQRGAVERAYYSAKEFAALMAVTRLASVHADHSDYQPEWKP